MERAWLLVCLSLILVMAMCMFLARSENKQVEPIAVNKIMFRIEIDREFYQDATFLEFRAGNIFSIVDKECKVIGENIPPKTHEFLEGIAALCKEWKGIKE